MYRVQRFYLVVPLVPVVFQLQQHRYQPRVPVVCIYYVWEKVYRRQTIQHRSRKKAEPFRVVVVPVHPITIKIFFVVHKVERHSFIVVPVDSYKFCPPAYVYRSVVNVLHAVAKFLAYFAELRHYYADVYALCF